MSGEPWRNSIGRAHLSHTAWPLGGRGRLRLLLRPHEQTAPSGVGPRQSWLASPRLVLACRITLSFPGFAFLIP